jgi:hypothetical protein
VKLVSAQRPRRAIPMLQDRLGLSELRACRYVGQPRSIPRRGPIVARDDAALQAQLRAYAREGHAGAALTAGGPTNSVRSTRPRRPRACGRQAA